MNKIIIDDIEIPFLDKDEHEEFYNGKSRRILTVTAPVDAIGLESLYGLLTEENLANISITDEDGTVEEILDGYVLRLFCGIENKLIEGETPDTAAVYEDRIVFKLGKRTYIEEQLHRLGLA